MILKDEELIFVQHTKDNIKQHRYSVYGAREYDFGIINWVFTKRFGKTAEILFDDVEKEWYVLINTSFISSMTFGQSTFEQISAFLKKLNDKEKAFWR